MNIANLQDKYPELLLSMENAGYSKDYMGRVQREIKHLLSLAKSSTLLSYADVYRKYERDGVTANTLARKRGLLVLIEQFDLYGQLPNGIRRKPLFPKGAYHHLCAEYKAVIDYYIDAEKKRGIKETVVENDAKIGATFLLSMQESGASALTDITEANVLAFFTLPDGTIKNGSYRKHIAGVIKACIPAFPTCKQILTFLPMLRAKHRNIQYLIDEEVSKVKNVLADSKSEIPLRDKAIITIALYTGLRSSDIAGMKMNAIDWDNDMLNIQQQKTGVPLTLPMSAVVGNIIFDYIKEERPKADCEYVFISQRRPFGKLTNVGICSIVQKFMKAADIRQMPGSRKGLHIFRHHLATTLLGNGVARPVISSIIGHTSPNSLDTYLSADFPHLKNCAISIEQYPVASDVFLPHQKYVSCFAPLIEAFINYRNVSDNSRGNSFEPNLMIFDKYCKRQYPDANVPKQEMIDSWCRQRDTETNKSYRARINGLATMIKYSQTRGYANLVPPAFPANEYSTYIPHAFTEDELINFFDACDNLNTISSPVGQSRKITVPVFFRLLYSSGIRTTDARTLRLNDVDLNRGILNVQLTKGCYQHYIALHDSMTQLLRQYDIAIRRIYPVREYFFPASEKTYHTSQWVTKNFRECWFKNNKTHAIPYELRHHYATSNINSWLDEGFGFDAKLLYLSKSMGHSVIESTKYYYSLIPGFSDILEKNTNVDFETIVPEVKYDEIH